MNYDNEITTIKTICNILSDYQTKIVDICSIRNSLSCYINANGKYLTNSKSQEILEKFLNDCNEWDNKLIKYIELINQHDNKTTIIKEGEI